MSEKANDTTMFVPAAQPTRKTWANEVVVFLLLVLSPALLVGAFLSDFHRQDHVYLQANPVVVAQDLSAGVHRVFDPGLVEQNVPPGWYAPLAELTTGLQYRLLGPLPWSFRLVNLLLHIATAWFLYRIVLGLMPRGAPLSAAEEPINADAPFNTSHHVVAAFGALFYFLHPANVESLAWASQRGCVQAGFFTVLAWWLITRQGPDRGHWRCLLAPSWACYVLSLLCLALAILSHPMACAAAGVLAFTQCVWVHESTETRWLRTLGFLATGLVFAGFSAKAHLWTPGGGSEVPLGALVVLGRSLLNILLPTTLSATYAFVPPTGPGDPGIWVAVALVLFVVAVPAWLPFGGRPAGVLLPGLFLMLLPWVIPGAGRQALGNAGLCLALPIAGVMFALGAEGLQYRLRFMGKEGGKIGETVGFGLAVLFFLMLSLLSLARSFAFQNDESLYREAVSRQPLSYLANLRLAEEIGRRARQTLGSAEDARQDWEEAYRHLEVLNYTVDCRQLADPVRQGVLEGEAEMRLGLEGAEEKLRNTRELAGLNHPLASRIGELLAEMEATRQGNQGQDAGAPVAP